MEQITKYWSDALEIMKNTMTEVSFNTWVKPIIPYKIEDSVFMLKIESDAQGIQRSMVNRYMPQIKEAVRMVTKQDFTIKLLTEDEISNAPDLSKLILSDAAKSQQADRINNLNPRYVFDTFVVGNSNRLAHAASLAVAEAPAKAYNPLFLYGDVGLGKTHLMHSIAHYILEQNPSAKVLYASSETFTNELINSIKDDKNEEFRNKYRNIDVLLIDDIQFISQKERTQEEFFHTFNQLYESNKQIIISSDRPPKEIKTLEDRLRSRFECGLIADIQSPDYETRIAILRKKADNDHITVPDEIMEFIAKNIVSNIRELEGALTRVVAYGNLTKRELTIDFAESALKDIFNEKSVQITPALIQEIVANEYNITADDIIGSKKPKNIAFPRQIAMYLSRKILDMSLPKIGEQFGGRDHTTVIYACSKVEKEMEQNPQLQKKLLELERKIKGQ